MTLSNSKLSGDSLDLRGLAIIAERQRLAQKIGLHKIQHGIPVYDIEREKLLLQSFCEGAKQRGIASEGAGKVLERLFLASREVQQKIFDTLSAQDVALAKNGDEEFMRLRISMKEINDKLLEYMVTRARIIAAGKKEDIFTKEQWITIAKISPYDLAPELAGELYDLLSKVTLKPL